MVITIMELYKLTASELSKLLEKRETSALEIAKSCFERIGAVEKDVEAYITLQKEEALKDAEAVDKRRASGDALSPLAGIPIGIKDNMCTEA
jgi:aspartyl-tRNA(Asn)/glutamyl-tRNA(Gln) amidotransferase subunit A